MLKPFKEFIYMIYVFKLMPFFMVVWFQIIHLILD